MNIRIEKAKGKRHCHYSGKEIVKGEFCLVIEPIKKRTINLCKTSVEVFAEILKIGGSEK